jgi:hypothetical protein
MAVIDQRHEQMLQRRIFVAAAARFPKRIVKGLFELAGETWHGGGLLGLETIAPGFLNCLFREALQPLQGLEKG